ncbi:MAG: ABC transporter ATP-binding protein [Coriobacteriales bacterium]|jgi:zinc transport system ATP-binding protein|nr:ABC transporter ATP-binding protein [Coriobacteriales bacterium]
MSVLLTCTDVTFSYEGRPAVTDLCFTLERGDYLCVVGENGSGKSTLVKGLLGLMRPSKGTMAFDPAFDCRRIGYVPQQSSAQRNFPASVTEIVLSGLLGHKRFFSFYSAADRARARDILATLDLDNLHKRSFGELSGGQQQRVLLARALCGRADGLELLVLDEPMSGLDPHIKTGLYELVRALNSEQGITVCMVTHDVNTAVGYASKMLLLSTHQEFFGSTHEFQHNPLGRDLMRDSCGGHCAVCGVGVGGRDD